MIEPDKPREGIRPYIKRVDPALYTRLTMLPPLESEVAEAKRFMDGLEDEIDGKRSRTAPDEPQPVRAKRLVAEIEGGRVWATKRGKANG